MENIDRVIEELERALRVWLYERTDRNLMLVQPDVVEDALEWLKKLAKCNHDCKIDCLLDAYNRVVAERDALKKGSGEWISVKDRLPEEDGRYLIYDGDRVDAADYIYNLGPIWLDTAEGYYEYKATHWMPLPEPPKQHPEPQYPTWGQWLGEQYGWNRAYELEIPADIAEKLGIEPNHFAGADKKEG